ncbi:DUF4268 domain-containing protein [Sphingobacterium sp. SYP-B4668]|uniref:DUF4268 domain-containing protein n=1 Tax=Sphingobacterium sp. SYP-B4668 TaxID=2996035 RepID=UPI0022DDBCD4|nr:DUF4268 domain-containing protein [Sphingobacterium sp. SYP-B4668]
MYARDEIKQIKEKFWTKFGQFMTLTLNSEGEKINWVNYKTGIKHLYFRMDATNKSASILIQMDHPDSGIRSLMMEQFGQYKILLNRMLGEEWEWQLEHIDEHGKEWAFIGTTLLGVSIFREEDWPVLMMFFKSRLLILDEFWNNAQHGFDLFR